MDFFFFKFSARTALFGNSEQLIIFFESFEVAIQSDLVETIRSRLDPDTRCSA